MKKIILIAFAVFTLSAMTAFGQASNSEADRAAIKQAALDYIEGWYEGDGARMERSLHPDLVKRIVRNDPQGASRLQPMTAVQLVDAVKGGGGTKTPKGQQQKDVTILDVFGNTATVKLVARDWVDYMHIAKFNGRWVIVNVLWEMKPKK